MFKGLHSNYPEQISLFSLNLNTLHRISALLCCANYREHDLCVLSQCKVSPSAFAVMKRLIEILKTSFAFITEPTARLAAASFVCFVFFGTVKHMATAECRCVCVCVCVRVWHCGISCVNACKPHHRKLRRFSSLWEVSTCVKWKRCHCQTISVISCQRHSFLTKLTQTFPHLIWWRLYHMLFHAHISVNKNSWCYFHSLNSPSLFLLSGGRGRNSRRSSEKWQQTGKEMAQRHLAYNDPQNIQDGAEGSGWRGGNCCLHTLTEIWLFENIMHFVKWFLGINRQIK